MKKEQIAVIGAGAFGGWIAFFLQQRGHQVTLIDAYGAGNSRSSSGDETRVIRAGYTDELYAKMAMRALALWQKYEAIWQVKILHQSSVLSLLDKTENRWATAKSYYDAQHWKYEELSPQELQKRFPLLNTDDIEKAVLETDSGFLMARVGCQAVLKSFVSAGGIYKIANAQLLATQNEQLTGISLSDGTTLRADKYIFACGAWLGKIFPDEIGSLIQSTRQELFYFGLPAQETARWQHFPTWLDFVPCYKNTMFYGIPAGGSDAALRGFKIGEDSAGAAFDPDTGERFTSNLFLKRVRKYLAYRYPSLKNAPVTESRVCQYESTADAHFLVDQLPTAQNVWVMGGGSGHGYKMGAALGEWTCAYLHGEVAHEGFFGFDRFRNLRVEGEVRR